MLDLQVNLQPSGWTGTPNCNWTGVTCDQGHYIVIKLSEMNLTGTIPSIYWTTSMVEVS